MAGKKYYVVTFLQQPYPYIERYVCVPQSWVTLQPTQEVILVSYPNENPAITRNRVENNEKSNIDWTSYKAEMKYITDEYDDADTWIATMYDDAVVDSNSRSTPRLSSSTNNIAPWNNNSPNGCGHLKINTQEPSTSDLQEKSEEKPLNNNLLLQSLLKRKLSETGTEENEEKPFKTIKIEPLDENDNYASENKENSYSVNPMNQGLSPILIDEINDIDMIDNNNKSTSSSINKTLLNPLANNYSELAKLLLDEILNKNGNIPNKTLESSSQKHSESECLEFTIKEEISSPKPIEVSDGEEGIDRDKKQADKNNAEEIPATQPDIVTPIQSEQTVTESNKSKAPDQSLQHNEKENQLTRPFYSSDCEQGKLPQQAEDKISDTQSLINITVTHGILKEKPHKPPENHKGSMQDPTYPVNTENPNKNPENDKGMQDPKFPVDTVQSLVQNTPPVSKEPFKLPQESIEDVNSSAFKVLVQKDNHLNRIIITRSDEPEPKKSRKSNNGRVQRKNVAQNMPQNTLPIEPPPNVALQPQNPLNALTSSMQRFTNAENQGLPITRHLNVQAPPHNQYPQSDSRYLHQMFHRSRLDRLPQTIERMSEERQQNIANTKLQEPAKATNPNPQAERSTNGPKIKGYLLEDPRTGQVFVHRTTPDNIPAQRAEYHNPENNKNVEKQKLTPVNQANHLRPERQENQFVRTSGGTFYPGNQPERLPQPVNMHSNNPRPQMNPQNPHGVPNSFQPPNNFDSYPQGRRFSPASQDSNYYQDSRMQQPMMRPGPNEIRPMGPPNVNVGFQNYPPMRSVGDERFSSNHSFRCFSSYEARMEEWLMSISQKLDFIYAKLSKM